MKRTYAYSSSTPSPSPSPSPGPPSSSFYSSGKPSSFFDADAANNASNSSPSPAPSMASTVSSLSFMSSTSSSSAVGSSSSESSQPAFFLLWFLGNLFKVICGVIVVQLFKLWYLLRMATVKSKQRVDKRKFLRPETAEELNKKKVYPPAVYAMLGALMVSILIYVWTLPPRQFYILLTVCAVVWLLDLYGSAKRVSMVCLFYYRRWLAKKYGKKGEAEEKKIDIAQEPFQNESDELLSAVRSELKDLIGINASNYKDISVGSWKVERCVRGVLLFSKVSSAEGGGKSLSFGSRTTMDQSPQELLSALRDPEISKFYNPFLTGPPKVLEHLSETTEIWQEAYEFRKFYITHNREACLLSKHVLLEDGSILLARRSLNHASHKPAPGTVLARVQMEAWHIEPLPNEESLVTYVAQIDFCRLPDTLQQMVAVKWPMCMELLREYVQDPPSAQQRLTRRESSSSLFSNLTMSL